MASGLRRYISSASTLNSIAMLCKCVNSWKTIAYQTAVQDGTVHNNYNNSHDGSVKTLLVIANLLGAPSETGA